MTVSVSANQFASKLGISDISKEDEKQIQNWLDSIAIEETDNASIDSKQFKTEMINFNRLDNDESLKIIKRLSFAFRYLFTNTYDEFIFFPSEGRKYSLNELLDVKPGAMFSNEDIYSFPIDCLSKKSSFDKSVYEHPMFCHDPEITFQNIKRKLEQRGNAVIIIDEVKRQIVGFAFGYQSSLKEAWSFEEWVHPFVYSRFNFILNELSESDPRLHQQLNDRYVNKFDDFLAKFDTLVRDGLGGYGLPHHRDRFEPDDCVYIFNAIATHPQMRMISKPSEMCGACLGMLDEHVRNNILGLGEAVFESNAYKMFQIGGMKDIYGVLNPSSDRAIKGDNVLMVGPLSSVLEAALLPRREFMKRYIRFHRKKKGKV